MSNPQPMGKWVDRKNHKTGEVDVAEFYMGVFRLCVSRHINGPKNAWFVSMYPDGISIRRLSKRKLDEAKHEALELAIGILLPAVHLLHKQWLKGERRATAAS